VAGPGAAVSASHRQSRSDGTTLLVAYVFVGEVLGMCIGGWEAARQPPALVVDATVHVSRPGDDAGDDAAEHDPVVGWSLLGLVSGVIAGASAGQLHLAARRWHEQRADG